MSTANVTTEPTGPAKRGWQPALTPRDAAIVGISRKDYGPAAQYARMAVDEHKRLGTASGRWEPTASLNGSLAAPFIAHGEQELASRLGREADPPLDEAQDLVENVKANLDEIAEHGRPLTGSEGGPAVSVAEAADRVEQHNATIEQDKADGRHHHERASVWLQRLATAAPWVEALGFLTFVTYYLNVPVFQPWQDWLGWSFAVTVVTVIILGQTWLVRHAAKSHNHAREVSADDNRHEAQPAFTRRNRYLALTAVTALAVTSGMVWRGIAAIGNASLGTTLVMVFAAAITGMLLPTLAYLGLALDGSRISRERDSLMADLDDDLDNYLETISDSRRDLAAAAEIGDKLRDKTFPDICHTTQEAVDAVYGFYGHVRMLIGGLSADPLSRTPKMISQDAAGNLHGYIGTSIPGADKVNLAPLFDREHRLEEIEIQRTDLLRRIEALPPHPWGRSRT